MNKIKMIGMRHMGAVRLWRGPEVKIGVFASRKGVEVSSQQRELWAAEQGRLHHCVVGTFHSHAECEVLNGVLANGGFAVWIRGCDFPRDFTDIWIQALLEGRLLIISCFHRKRHTEATARYCSHLVAMCTKRHVYWLRKDEDFLRPICQKAISWGKEIDVY